MAESAYIAIRNIHSQPLTLPPEIWGLVLRNLTSRSQGIYYLWTTCRSVSSIFCNEVERIFVAIILPKTLIRFCMVHRLPGPLDGTPNHFRYNGRIVNANFRCSVSGDRSRAVFTAPLETAEAMESRSRHDRKDAYDTLRSYYFRVDVLVDSIEAPLFLCAANGDIEIGWKDIFIVIFAEHKVRGERQRPARECCPKVIVRHPWYRRWPKKILALSKPKKTINHIQHPTMEHEEHADKSLRSQESTRELIGGLAFKRSGISVGFDWTPLATQQSGMHYLASIQRHVPMMQSHEDVQDKEMESRIQPNMRQLFGSKDQLGASRDIQ